MAPGVVAIARRVAWGVGAAVAVWSLEARAGGGAATDGYDGVRPGEPLDVQGLIDVYGQAMVAPRHEPVPLYRAFDDAANGAGLGLARVTFAHAPRVFGFRLDLGAGALADSFRDLDPDAAAHPGTARGLSYIEQGFVTLVVPLSPGASRKRELLFEAGKFGTPVGLEENESLTNAQYSRGLLFTLAEPTYHTGLRATLRLSDRLACTAFALNGWNTNFASGNGLRSYALAATWNPSDKTEIVVDYMAGLERAITRLADPALHLRHEVDGYATYALTDRVSFAVTADYGHDAASGGADWWGVGGYLRGQILSWLGAAARGEHMRDDNGFTSGTRQRLAELTLTVEGRLPPDVSLPARFAPLVRLEYRRDRSDEPVFRSASGGGLTRQDTLTLAFVASVL